MNLDPLGLQFSQFQIYQPTCKYALIPQKLQQEQFNKPKEKKVRLHHESKTKAK